MKKKLLAIIVAMSLILSFTACGEADGPEKLTTELVENVEVGIPENFEFVNDEADSDYNIFHTYREITDGDESDLIIISSMNSDYANTEIDAVAIDRLRADDRDISDVETVDLNGVVGKLFTLPNIKDYNEHDLIFFVDEELFQISLITKDSLEKSHFKDIVNSVKILSRVGNVCFEVSDKYQPLTPSEQEDLMGKEMMESLNDSITYYAEIDDNSIILNIWCRDTDSPSLNDFIKSIDGKVLESVDISATKGVIIDRNDVNSYHNYTLYFLRNKNIYAFDMFSESETILADLKKIADSILFI